MNILSDACYRLLIVDDNEAIHEDLKKILLPMNHATELLEDEALLFGTTTSRALRFQIDSAFQGEQGLQMLQKSLADEQPYAVAFVDLRMPPGWDGVETIERLWQVDPYLQIVICTAYSDYNWSEIGCRLGISQNLVILKKPFDPIEVLQLAHALSDKWSSARQVRWQMVELDRLIAERTNQLHTTIGQLREARDQAQRTAAELRHNQIMMDAAEAISSSGAWRED